MKDRLEEFILRQREAFDSEVPALKVWTGVEHQIHKKKYRRLAIFRMARLAAGIVLILGLGTFLGVMLTQNGLKHGMGASLTLSDISHEYARMESWFQHQIEEKERVLLPLVDDPSLLEDLAAQETQLEELQRQLAEVPRTQQKKMIDAILQHYQARVDMLDKVLGYLKAAQQSSAKQVNYYD
jgi:hypothetical protein